MGSAGLLGAGGVRLGLGAGGAAARGRQAVERFGRGVALAATATAGAAAGREVGPKRRGVQAVDDRVAAGVEVAEDEEDVVDVLGRHLQHLRLKPVPDPQQVVRRPAHHEGHHDDDGHLQRLHPGLGDRVRPAASQARLSV